MYFVVLSWPQGTMTWRASRQSGIGMSSGTACSVPLTFWSTNLLSAPTAWPQICEPILPLKDLTMRLSSLR